MSSKNSKTTQPAEDTRRWHFTLHPSVQLVPETLTSVFTRFAHPTRAVLSHSDGIDLEWRSRSHRKHRYRFSGPSPPTRAYQKLLNLFKVEYWNISWWVAWSFTIGSVVWVINGFAGFLPLCDYHHFQVAHESPGWTAFVGATIFELGSVLGMFEAWNRDDVTSFGWNVERLLGMKRKEESDDAETETGAKDQAECVTVVVESKHHKPWVWFTTDRKFWHELGFLASFFQLMAASVFWISGFTAIPAIQTSIQNNGALEKGIFWTPQVIGGTGFIISATLIMLESQKKWYKPDLRSIGWHVGFWNFVGAVGFTLCGALGYASSSNSKALYQSALSTFWGGWAFLIGSVIQLYEVVNPV